MREVEKHCDNCRYSYMEPERDNARIILRQKCRNPDYNSLIKAAHLDRDDVYQQLAIRLIRAVESFDPDKSELAQHINAQLQYELLNCTDSRTRYGLTGAPRDLRGAVISLEACGDMPCYDLLAA